MQAVQTLIPFLLISLLCVTQPQWGCHAVDISPGENPFTDVHDVDIHIATPLLLILLTFCCVVMFSYCSFKKRLCLNDFETFGTIILYEMKCLVSTLQK